MYSAPNSICNSLGCDSWSHNHLLILPDALISCCLTLSSLFVADITFFSQHILDALVIHLALTLAGQMLAPRHYNYNTLALR